ncbi:hypothetical protein PR048_027294 [Dryococelus australis]|uniref:Uncharacterized protein n=1 Tax=Dryococelus australis TaxID=614101 RepID=A0ABQ9GGM3_9NEOP|nr:hypothetical protein PR048_027294 [Dryococelus australis]
MDAGENSNWPKRKKRKERKEHIVKKPKVTGKEHINHGEEKLHLLSEFNYLESKNEHDSYLSILMSAFISLHGITKGRLYNIQQCLLTSEKSPKDQRCKHDNRPMKYPSAIHDIIVQHIQSFHARSSHYSLRDNPDWKYPPESLAIKNA